MEAVINFLNEYGILSAIITAAASALGVLAKKLWDKTVGDKVKEDTKKDVANLVVKYVEQVYKDIHGEEKLEKALEAFSEMLGEKGITISDLEMRVLLEAALAGFNNAFTKTAEGAEG
jgi:intergrase/recombinase